jgi:predicted hydrocarbon binding protein
MSELDAVTGSPVQALFGAEQARFDLAEGTVRTRDADRQLFVSTETLYGIYKALDDETGDAWRIVLRNCGHDWGRRLMGRLDTDLRRKLDRGCTDLQLEEFLDTVCAYFAWHGWGRLELDVSRTEAEGILVARLHDSVVAEALAELSGPTDHLIEGMLRAIIEFVADRDLACVQITGQRRRDGTLGEFLVSSPDRIGAIESLAGNATLDEALADLAAA